MAFRFKMAWSLLGCGVALASFGGAAQAVSARVQDDCYRDYNAYCSSHAPESTEVRYCMEAHRNQLTQKCVSALVDAGEVPRKYLTKQGRQQ